MRRTLASQPQPGTKVGPNTEDPGGARGEGPGGTLTPDEDSSSSGWSGTTKMRLTNLRHKEKQGDLGYQCRGDIKLP